MGERTEADAEKWERDVQSHRSDLWCVLTASGAANSSIVGIRERC